VVPCRAVVIEYSISLAPIFRLSFSMMEEDRRVDLRYKSFFSMNSLKSTPAVVVLERCLNRILASTFGATV